MFDFYDCGFFFFFFTALPSAAVKAEAGAALQRRGSRLGRPVFMGDFFMGGLSDCPGTPTGHKLTPRLGLCGPFLTGPG